MLGAADLPQLFKEAFKQRGVTPGHLTALTAQQLFALFYVLKRPGVSAPDKVAGLRKHNHELRAARGMPPVIPPWLWTEKPARAAKPRPARRPTARP